MIGPKITLIFSDEFFFLDRVYLRANLGG